VSQQWDIGVSSSWLMLCIWSLSENRHTPKIQMLSKCDKNDDKSSNHRNFWDARKIVRLVHSHSGLCCHQAERRWYNLCIWKFAGPDWRIWIRRWLYRGFVNGVSPTWTIRMYYLNRYDMSECCFNWVRPVFRHTSIMNLSTSNSGWHINRCWNDGNLPRLSVKAHASGAARTRGTDL
jgi:hypothetical protein